MPVNRVNRVVYFSYMGAAPVNPVSDGVATPSGTSYFGEYLDDIIPVVVTGVSGLTDLDFGSGFAQVQGFFTPPPTVNPENIVFRSVRSRLAARYSGSVIVEILDDPFVNSDILAPTPRQSQSNPDLQSFVATWNAVKLSPDPSDQWLNVTIGFQSRLDIVSQASYGRSDLWWAIALANDIINPFEQPLAGDKIRIPTFSRIIRLFGQVGVSS